MSDFAPVTVCLAYTGVMSADTDAEERRGSVKDSKAGHKSLSEYVDEIKSKHLINVNDYSVSTMMYLAFNYAFLVRKSVNFVLSQLV